MIDIGGQNRLYQVSRLQVRLAGHLPITTQLQLHFINMKFLFFIMDTYTVRLTAAYYPCILSKPFHTQLANLPSLLELCPSCHTTVSIATKEFIHLSCPQTLVYELLPSLIITIHMPFWLPITPVCLSGVYYTW